MSSNNTRIKLTSTRIVSHKTKASAYHCFEAIVCFDDVKICRVSHSGDSDSVMSDYRKLKGQSQVEFVRAMKECAEYGSDCVRNDPKRAHYSESLSLAFDDEDFKEWLSKKGFKDKSPDYDWKDIPDEHLLDWLIRDLVNEHACLEEMRTTLKNNLVAFQRNQNKIVVFKIRPSKAAIEFAKEQQDIVLRHSFKNKKPKAVERLDLVWMNELDEDQAFKIWRTAK